VGGGVGGAGEEVLAVDFELEVQGRGWFFGGFGRGIGGIEERDVPDAGGLSGGVDSEDEGGGHVLDGGGRFIAEVVEMVWRAANCWVHAGGWSGAASPSRVKILVQLVLNASFMMSTNMKRRAVSRPLGWVSATGRFSAGTEGWSRVMEVGRRSSLGVGSAARVKESWRMVRMGAGGWPSRASMRSWPGSGVMRMLSAVKVLLA
jgi:hypothetical protein